MVCILPSHVFLQVFGHLLPARLQDLRSFSVHKYFGLLSNVEWMFTACGCSFCNAVQSAAPDPDLLEALTNLEN